MKVKIGNRYERLLVTALISDRKNPKAVCLCDCGKVVTPQRGALTNGRAKSCGCLRADLFVTRNTSHGESGSQLHSIWLGMRARCESPSNKFFHNYGGRGIRVSADWSDYVNFARDMGPCPDGMTLERKDTNGNYEKNNCIWADWATQATNKRVSRRWVIHGVEYRSSHDAARAIGVDPSTINRRANGCTRRGVTYPSVDGYSSHLAYSNVGVRRTHQILRALGLIASAPTNTETEKL